MFFVNNGKVKRKSVDPAEAVSLLKRAIRRINYFSVVSENVDFMFEGLYEAVRECLQSFMSLEGYTPYSHEAVIVFALEKKIISESEAMKIDHMRKIRNDILYRGSDIDINIVEDIIPFVRVFIPKMEKIINRRLQESGYAV